MILSNLRRYMKDRGRASLEDLAAHFDMDGSALEGMMHTLILRGEIIELSCGGCQSAKACSSAGPKIYANADRFAPARNKAGGPSCRPPEPV